MRLTQGAMARKAGVSRNTLIGWEKGSRPQPRHREAAIEAYELPEDFFYANLTEFESRIQAEVAGIRADLDRLLEHFGATPDGAREAADRAADTLARERRPAG